MMVQVTLVSADELLTAVKNSLNICGTHFDTTLQLYIDEIKEYLRSSGISDVVIGSNVAIGCISRGVADSWNYGNGDTKLSEYFYQRAEQLRSITATIKPAYTKAKIIVNVTDSATGAALPTATFSITGATKEEDGFYYLESSDTVWGGLATCTGYKMKRFTFMVTENDVSAGEKIVPVELTAS